MSLEPSMAVPCVSLVRPATATGVRGIRRAISVFAEDNGAHGHALAAIELAVSEAVANVVVHAYPGAPGDVTVMADVENGELELVVIDDGQGFRTDPTPGLGLGLGLMRQDAAAFEVRDRPSGGVEVWLRFSLEG
jgi:anti-sigma regulatory factor (Ser/Thr protein kinase)